MSADKILAVVMLVLIAAAVVAVAVAVVLDARAERAQERWFAEGRYLNGEGTER